MVFLTMRCPESHARWRAEVFRSICAGVEARANLFRNELRLFSGRIVIVFADVVVIDEFVIRTVGPTPRGLIVLARKHTHGSRDRDVGGVVNAELVSQ